MNVIGHQAVRPDAHPSLPAPLGHQLQVSRVIILAKERLLPPISSLGYVVRQTRNDQSRQSSHAAIYRITPECQYRFVSQDSPDSPSFTPARRRTRGEDRRELWWAVPTLQGSGAVEPVRSVGSTIGLTRGRVMGSVMLKHNLRILRDSGLAQRECLTDDFA